MCEHLVLICSIALARRSVPLPASSPFPSSLPFPSARGQAPGPGPNRTGPRRGPGNASLRWDIESRLGVKRANPPRRDGREEAADSPVCHPSPENINPRNAIKILPALIKQHCSLEDSLCTQMLLRSPCHLFFFLQLLNVTF